MPILKRQVASSTKGQFAEKEDWWFLVLNTDTKEFYVEHEWSHTNAYRISDPSREGKRRIDLATYLTTKRSGELLRLLGTLFG